LESDMATFGEVLAQFKESEEAENVAPLVEDDTLRNGVIAWKSVVTSIRCGAGEQCGESDPARQWDWLWSRVEFDVAHFGVVAGCRAQDASGLFSRLKGLRLIYPDGTIQGFASQYLQAMIMAKLKRASK